MERALLISYLILCLGFVTTAVELTFELPDSEKQCFYEGIVKGVESSVDFQVLDGGNYDVDATLTSPSGQVLMTATKKQSETYTWTADQTGVYVLCFSNEFSTFTHKLVYVDFQVGDETPLPGVVDHPMMTKLETSSKQIHERLNTIVDYQTHHKLMESKGRKRAEELNTRVLYWSIGECIVLISIGFCQIVVLRSFFNDKK